jgi:Zn-dependent M28 family amino/carboxypeptidase
MPLWLTKVPPKRTPDAIESLAPEVLMDLVRELSFSREWRLEAEANRRAAQIVRGHLEADGRVVEEVGRHRNLVALPEGDAPMLVVGAHYDSVLGTPGADDNASAVAVMLGVSRALRALVPDARVGFVAFNAEEDGIRGSEELAADWARARSPKVTAVHVLEMLGFASDEPGSQQFPPGLLSKLPVPDVANFLGLLANGDARRALRGVVKTARRGCSVPVVALQTLFGFERLLPSLDLSDHIRFWEQGIPSVMWTDTAFYRNPHYHLASDTPETLDPGFMSGVAHLLFHVVERTAPRG